MARASRTKKPEDLKVTPEQHAHLKAIAPKKGGPSRNPNGRPSYPEEIKGRAGEMSMAALERIEWLAENSPNEMVRFRCNEFLLSLVVSKAAQEQKIDMSVTHSFGDLLARVNAQRNVIDARPEDITVIEGKSS